MFQNIKNKTTIGIILCLLCMLMIHFAFDVKTSNPVNTKHPMALQQSWNKSMVTSHPTVSGQLKHRINSVRQLSTATTLIPGNQMQGSFLPVKLTAYLAMQQTGIIGSFDGKQADNPADNIFTIRFDKQPTVTDRVWLTYKLTGVDDYSNVVCSINDRQSMGGYLAKRDTGTHRQRIQLCAAWIQKGKNRIRFGIPENAGYGYKVSDLSIEVERDGNESPLTVNAGKSLYNGKAYIHGFMQGNVRDKAVVKIDGKKVITRDGEFETIVAPVGKQQVEVTAELQGKLYSKTIRFNRNAQPDNEYALEERKQETSKTFEKGIAEVLQTENTQLKVNDKALLTTLQLSVLSLRNIDLPALDMGMSNVTDGKKGVRFLPHGEHFTDGATVALKYDRTKIPDGYTENDIKTYYFDNTTNHWVALERDTVDKSMCMVVSKTTHFTDMINGIIKTPESPETEGFTPTMMSGIKAADPTAKIELIAPPTANNQGSANLSYPLELPPARSGISPNLAIQYNSDGGSGWLGEGWDLNVPSITVDTRWGVPRYDALYETETYSMGGSMLATVVDTSSTATLGGASVGHKGVLYQRLTGITDVTGVNEGVQFHPVTESGFNRISRLGSAANSYSWKVVTKDGLTYSYGATSDSKLSGNVTNFQYQTTDKTNNLYNSKKNKLTTGVIAEWKLSSVEDQYRNFCRYHYSSETNKIHGNNVTANCTYLSSIEIGRKKSSGTSESDTLYQRIYFYPKTTRQKLSSNGRYGFLTSNSSLLLDSIKIEQILPDKSTSSARGYKFRYIQGPFNTLLLNKVIQCDSAWSEVANHAFSYYDNVAKSLYSSTEETFKTASVESGSSIPASESGFPALGGSKGSSSGTSFYIGASASFSLFGLGISAGAGYNYSSSSASSDTKMMMIDINGDGLPDKVYRASYNGANCLCFIPNLSNGKFGISGIPIIGYTGGLSGSESASYTNGWRANVGAGKKNKCGVTFDAGMDWMNGSSQTSTYLSDVNSDGLVDIVSNDTVHFNYISYYDSNGTGIPAFTTNSGLTARPILNMKTPRGKAQVLQLSDNFQQTPTPSRTLSLDPVSACDLPIKRNALTALREKIDDYSQVPMQDIVRLWEAPYPGNVKISTYIKYLGDTFIPDLDGVKLAIQTKGKEIWTDSIKPIKPDENFIRERNTSNTIHVDAGQRIYFRLQSGSGYFSDFLEDVVIWQQTITYSNPMIQYHQEGYPDGVYKSSDGAFVSQEYDNVIDSVTGFEISGKFSKPITQDSVFLKIYCSVDSLLLRDSLAMMIKTDTIVGYNGTTNLVNDTSYVKYKIWEPNINYFPEELSWEKKFGKEQINNVDLYGGSFDVPKGPLHCRFELSANENETWDKIIWKPILNCQNNITGKDTIFYAGVKYDLFTQNCPFPENMNNLPGNLNQYRADTIITRINVNTKKKINSKYRLYVYSDNTTNTLLAKKQGYIINSKVDDLLDIMWSNQMPYYFVIYIDGKISPDSITATCKFSISSEKIYTPIVFCKQLANRTQFGHMWLGWGQFQYNTSCGRYAIPIKEDSLTMPSDISNEEMIKKMGINKMCMFTLNHKPYKNTTSWIGTNDHLLISGDTICTGRLNLEQIPTCLSPVIAESTEARSKVKRQFITASLATTPTTVLTGSKYEITTAPALTNRSSATTGWGGASVSIGKTGLNLGGNYTHSDGNNVITSAFMDLNGDGFPDYITDSQVEYTNQIGGRDGEVDSLANESSDNNSDSYGFNGGYSASKSLGDDGGGADNISAQLSRDFSVNIGYSHSTNNTISTTSYIDLNGDGLPDMVYKDNGKVYVCINLGYGFSSKVDWGLTDITITRSTSDAFSGSLSASSGKLMDLIFGSAGKLLEWLNKVGLGVSVGVNTVKTTSYSMCNLVDVNMDGLPDKIYKSQSGKVAVEFNTGNGFSQVFTIEEMEDLFKSVSSSTSANLGLSASFRILWIIKITLSASGSKGTSTDYTLNQLLDIDGDGYPDIVKASDAANQLDELKVKRSLIGATNKLAAITNPLGGITRLAYTRTRPTCDHPGGKWVMSSVTVNDGIDYDGDSLKTKFNYYTGKYDRNEREFLGFAEVVTDNMNPTQTVYRRVRQTYDNSNFYTRGALLSSVVCGMDGTTEKIYSQSTNKYHTYLVSRASDINNKTNLGKYVLNVTQPDATFTPDNMFLHQYIAYCPPKYNKNTVYEYSGTTQKSLVTSESYSDYHTSVGTHGELSMFKFSDKGALGEEGTGGYNYLTEINYLDKYGMTLFSLPTAITVTGGSDKKVYRQTKAVWNDNFASQLSMVKNVLASGDTAVTSMGYDQWGNIFQKELPGKTANVRMSYTYKYDKYYHLFLTDISDHFGYSSSLGNYNYKYGVACKNTDECQNTMLTKLDNLGRIISITGPNEYDPINPNKYTLKFVYHPVATKIGKSITAPAYAVTRHYDPANQNNNIATVTFVDGIGRPLQVKKKGYIDGTEKMIVSGRAYYDAYGRVTDSYYPVVEDTTKMTTFNPLFDSQTPTRNVYDVLDRITRTTLPDGTKTDMIYEIDTIKSINYLKTTVTDALSNQQITFSNGDGKTVRTVQRPGSAAIKTEFAYDAIDRLVTVTDTKGKQTISVYDQLGRRTQVTHPASGITRFEYDIAGNLTSKQTANMIASGKKIKYYYRYNRLDSIVYPDHSENNVRYVYGTTDDIIKTRRGRLKYQEDGSGGQEFWYGKQGELTQVRRTLVIPNQTVATYITNWTYDCWNRIQTMTYPDGEKLNYVYNTAGLLTGINSSANNYVSNITYDKFEQRASLKYGNGTTTNYTYNPLNRRMDNLNVKAGTNYIMNNTYTYDAVSNVKSVTNSGIASNNLGGAMVHNYFYDNLYRLDSANGVFTGPNNKTAKYYLKMGYDNLHNITKKKQNITQTGVQFAGTLNAGYNLAYTYADNSQQISNIADESYRTEGAAVNSPVKKTQNYGYDANGNLLYVNTGTKTTDGKLLPTNNRKLLWDEENRLLGISDNGFVSNYWYDAAGERTVKESGDVEGVSVNGVLSGARTGTTNFTAYISPYLVVNNGGFYSKHIYMGSQRIVSKLGSSDIFTIRNPLTDTTANKQNFIPKMNDLTGKIKVRYDSLGVVYKGISQGNGSLITSTAGEITSPQQYYFHSDHLGSTSIITDITGNVAQHIEYIPFGEVFIDERPASSTWSTPYKFNAKELDEETGLYYYGARYYDPRSSVWISVDPLAEEKPWLSSYVYCLNNPLKFIDPDGEDEWDVDKKTNKITQKTNPKADAIYVNDNGKRIDGVVMAKGSVNWIKGYNINKKENDGMNINGDENGTKVFKMLSNNSPYEWEQTKTGKNSNGNNIITSSTDISTNSANSTFMTSSSIQIRGDDHSHPRNTPYPSGTEKGATKGDVSHANEISSQMKKLGYKTPDFRIYLPGKKSYINFNGNSKRSDFPINPIIINMRTIEIKVKRK